MSKFYLSDVAGVCNEVRMAADYFRLSIEAQVPARRHIQGSRSVIHNLYPGLNLLFVHIPKCAGTRIHADLTKIELSLKSELPIKRRHSIGKHATAAEWRDYLSEQIWDNYFKFAFVRNPWDLMLSSYMWWRQHAGKFVSTRRKSTEIRHMSFPEFIRSDYGKFYINEIHARSIRDWTHSDSGKLVDHVAKVENIYSELNYITNGRYNNISRNSGKINVTKRDSAYRNYYDNESKNIVGDRFVETIKEFGYSF